MASLTHRYIPRHKYIPQTRQTEENLFIEEYYSSTDTKIYIDDIEQTEISYISYSLNEQLKPIFGYDSNTFDDVAIGSRIVTGVFKTPICNTEKQSTAEDIAAKALSATYGDKAPDIGDYNDAESERVDKTDWIGNTDKTPGESDSSDSFDQFENEELYEYRNKLELLGYLTEGNTSNDMLRLAIKLFQEENGISADGKLDQRTMDKIDAAIAQKDAGEALTIPVGTMIYATPTRSTPLYATGIPHEVKAFVMGVFEGAGGKPEWLWITTSDGIEGCVNINDNPEFKLYLDNSPPVYA